MRWTDENGEKQTGTYAEKMTHLMKMKALEAGVPEQHAGDVDWVVLNVRSLGGNEDKQEAAFMTAAQLKLFTLGR